jgi:hypothetical protein
MPAAVQLAQLWADPVPHFLGWRLAAALGPSFGVIGAAIGDCGDGG